MMKNKQTSNKKTTEKKCLLKRWIKIVHPFGSQFGDITAEKKEQKKTES